MTHGEDICARIFERGSRRTLTKRFERSPGNGIDVDGE